jgi:hypothetical protein
MICCLKTHLITMILKPRKKENRLQQKSSEEKRELKEKRRN